MNDRIKTISGLARELYDAISEISDPESREQIIDDIKQFTTRDTKDKPKKLPQNVVFNIKESMSRISHIDPIDYYNLRDLMELKLARLVDSLNDQKESGKIGAEEMVVYVKQLDTIFNQPNNEPMDMDLIQKKFKTVICKLADRLNIKEDELFD